MRTVFSGPKRLIAKLKAILKTDYKSNAAPPRDPQIILYQGPRGPAAPSFSPFVLKLETFMRMARLNYKNDHSGKKSSKGKIPWMKFNETSIADSQFSMDFLKDKLNLDLDAHLTPEQKAVAHAFQVMADEHYAWCMILVRLNDLDYLRKVFKVPRLLLYFGAKRFKNITKGQGLGRHSMAEVDIIMEKDVKALSDYLGDKRFLCGDKPCEADCSVFAQLAQAIYQAPGTKIERLLKEKYPNLNRYCDNMKATFWPDWDECITHDGTKKATK